MSSKQKRHASPSARSGRSSRARKGPVKNSRRKRRELMARAARRAVLSPAVPQPAAAPAVVPPAAGKKPWLNREKLAQNFSAWMIMVPSLILMLFFVWEPLFESVRMSLYKTRNVELVKFIGFDNYVSVMGKDDFLQALLNTFSYTFWSLLLGFLLPVVLAVIIGETRRSKSFFRTVAYLPNMLPGLAVIILWSSFFSAEKSGVLNILLSGLGVPAQTYLTRAEWVIPIIILIATWKGAGATALIYMASIAGISPELYEAAAIDGATVWERIWHILLPAIRKLMGTLLILQIISVFQIMYEPMVLTKGGPDNASLSLMQLMWRYAFDGSMNYGKASAVAVIVTLILLLMTAVHSYFDRKESDWD